MDLFDGPRPLEPGLRASLERIEQRILTEPPPQPDEVLTRLEETPGRGEHHPAEKAYTPALFTQLALPYRDPGNVAEWVRRNGARELVVTPGRVWDAQAGRSRPGYPYGVIPRLLVIWLTGEVIKHQAREVVLGQSLGGFMGRMGLTRSGSQATRVREQTTRLFTAAITVSTAQRFGSATSWELENVRVAHKARLWWDEADERDPFWLSTVTVSQEFYEAIVDGSVPLDSDALAALRSATRSPLALDIYAWLAHRLCRVRGGATPPIRWADIALQFGGDYGRLRAFKAQFLKDLKHVLAVYPAARVEPGPKGLVLHRSPSPVQRRN